MQKTDIADRLARVAHVSKGQAADTIDNVIHRIIKSMRRGEAPRARGLAELIGQASPEHTAKRASGRRSK